MITITLEAETVEELRAQLFALLPTPIWKTVTPPEPEPAKEEWKTRMQEETERLRKDMQEWKADPLQPIAATPAPAKPKRKHRATAAPEPEPEPAEPVLEDVDLTSFDSEEEASKGPGTEWLDYAAEDDADLPAAIGSVFTSGIPSNPLIDALANEKIKAEVIDRLAGLFNSGKVKFIRSILDEFGNGAKTFAEIDASQFPEIREAMNRGATP
jgi:hypothetical protein